MISLNSPLSQWVTLFCQVSTGCSLAANILPSERFLDGYPGPQKAYGAFRALVTSLALNLSKCIQSIGVPLPGGSSRPLGGPNPGPTASGSGGAGSEGEGDGSAGSGATRGPAPFSRGAVEGFLGHSIAEPAEPGSSPGKTV